ncbi:MAG TPA: energy-coupling factor transporter ATPase [Firmicutes bacterium]|nr:energy-coupling factor transporter ATPase [Bacillota bacterium]
MFIETEELTHIYSPGTPWKCAALKGINLSLERGSFVLITGPSGSGKSTLVQHFNGLLSPSSGRVMVNGQQLGPGKQLRQVRRQVGLVFQIPEQQFFSETVYDEVAFAPVNLDLTPGEVTARVENSLQLVGLDYKQLKGRSPFDLSAGQQRLVAIASVLALNPEALILDGPTAGLDSGGRQQLAGLLKQLHRREGFTVIVVSHRLEEFAALADLILVLDQGRLVISGSAEQVLSNPDFWQRYNLYLPSVTDIMHRLALSGAEVSTAVFDLQAARKEIISWWRRGCG